MTTNYFKYFLFLLLVLSFPFYSQAQTVGLFLHNNMSEDDGYVLFAPVNACDTTYLIDKCGRVMHKWTANYAPGLDAYLLPDGTLLRSGHYPNPAFDPNGGSSGGIIQRFDWNSNLLWQYVISDKTQTQNHDVFYMPNGHILAAVWEVIPDSVAIASGRNPGLLDTVLWSAKIVELEPQGTDSAIIVWQWRLMDHLVQDYDSTKANYGVVSAHPELLNFNYINAPTFPNNTIDWTHLNAVTYNPILDQVMISFHNLDEIYIIDHSTTTAQAASHSVGNHNKGGDFLYRYGNPQAYNRGTSADTKLFQQHDPDWIYSGKYANKISIFNNGTGRQPLNYSSVDIITPPIDSNGNYNLDSGAAYGPDTLSWTYGPTIVNTFFSRYMGGAQILPSGNVLICNAMLGTLFEIDTNNNTSWYYVNPINNGVDLSQYATPNANSVYRCTFYPFTYSGFNGNNFISNPQPLEHNPIPINCSYNNVEVNAISNTEGLKLYPNPADQVLEIAMEGLKHLFVCDVSGKVLFNQDVQGNNYSLNTALLAPGLYSLSINQTIHKQFVVLH